MLHTTKTKKVKLMNCKSRPYAIRSDPLYGPVSLVVNRAPWQLSDSLWCRILIIFRCLIRLSYSGQLISRFLRSLTPWHSVDLKTLKDSLTTCPSLVMTRSRKSTIHGFFCGAGGYAYDFEVSLFCACQVTAFLVIYCFVIVLQLSYQEASKYEFNV